MWIFLLSSARQCLAVQWHVQTRSPAGSSQERQDLLSYVDCDSSSNVWRKSSNGGSEMWWEPFHRASLWWRLAGGVLKVLHMVGFSF